MADELTSWARPHHRPTGAKALLFYIAYGDIQPAGALSRSRYRSGGVPAGCKLSQYSRPRDAETVEHFQSGYVWNEFRGDSPALAGAVADAPACMILRGEIGDPPTLDYLRDAVGLLTYLLDGGAVAIYDPQMFKWWSPDAWREHVFEPGVPVPRQHAVILISEEPTPDRLWVHTRGMRKFARPDLSVHGVPHDRLDAVVEMCDRFINLQALGGVIAEGEAVRMASLPPGGSARHGGHVDDPDFNNVHVHIVWPDPI